MAKRKTQHVHFDSIIGLSDYLDENWQHWEKGHKSGDSFWETLTHTECREILRNGGDHQPSADRMAQAELDMSKVPAGELELPQLTTHYAGHRPNVGAFLAGSPLSMFRFEPQPQPNKSVKMLVSITASAGVDHWALANRGAAILGAVDALQTQGYAVELTVGVFVKTHMNNHFYSTVKIKDFGDTWNPAAIAFMLAEPSFFRRSMFAVMNIEQVKDSNSVAAQLGSTLGQPIPKMDSTEYDIEFESMHYNEDWTPENSVSKAMEKVYNWLERNKAGAAA